MGTVAPGFRIPPWRLERVEAARMKTMSALMRDPNPIHFDPEATRALGLGDRVVNQGPANLGYIVNMLLEWVGDPAAIRRLRVRFEANVFAGDRVEASGEVTEVRDDGGGRVAVCDVWLRRDDGQRLVSGTAEVVVDEVG